MEQNKKFRGLYVFCKWTSPAILAFAYYRGYFSYEGLESITFMAYFFGIIFISTYVTRGISRCSNADYKLFIEKFTQMNKSTASSSDRKVMRQLIFDLLTADIIHFHSFKKISRRFYSNTISKWLIGSQISLSQMIRLNCKYIFCSFSQKKIILSCFIFFF